MAKNVHKATWGEEGKYAAFARSRDGHEDDCLLNEPRYKDKVEIYTPSDDLGELNVVVEEDFKNGAADLHVKLRKLKKDRPRFYLCKTDTGWRTFIVLQEYESVTGVPLTSKEYTALNEAKGKAAVLRTGEVNKAIEDNRAKELKSALDLRRDDQNGEVWTIKAGGVVGAINAGTLVVILLPKFPLMPMLMADYMRSRGIEPEDVHLHMEDSKLCYFILATRYAEALGKLSNSGLMQSFRRVEEYSRMCRGQINFAKLARNRGVLVPVPIRCSAVVRDTDENRILKYALKILLDKHARNDSLSQGLAAKLRYMKGMFTDVADIKFQGGAEAARRLLLQLRKLTAFYHHYKIPLRIAQEIIMAYRPTTLAGSHPVPSYLINMPYLFEDYIRREIIRRVKEKQCGTDLRVVEKQEYKLFQQEDSSTTCIPDLVLAEADEKINKFVFVGDMKYYKGDITSSAYYQMIAYCHRFGLNTGMIICANGDKEKELTYETERRGSLNHNVVSVEPVKLFTESEVNAKELMEAMKENLNELMRKIAEQAKKNASQVDPVSD
jgi:5-methylcytosine-specific restriction enzyme subunit McrC